MKKLIPREEIYDIYWHFAHERNEIFYRKNAGNPKPWTDDPILQKYKFCNSYRINDRGSQYLVGHVIYNGKIYKPADMVFRIILYRIFNLPSTWDALEKEFGDITLDNLNVPKWTEFLERLSRKQPVESNAYIMKPVPGKYSTKHGNWLAYLERLFKKSNFVEKLLSKDNMRDGFKIMNSAPNIGTFLAYQYCTDIAYSEVVKWQETDFTIPGGGANRGIHKVFQNPDENHLEEAIWWMYDHQEEEFAKRGYDFHKLGGKRKLQPIDLQNCFCETDKYCRVAHPELKSSAKDIKNTYDYAKRPTIEYVYPPKWNLDK